MSVVARADLLALALCAARVLIDTMPAQSIAVLEQSSGMATQLDEGTRIPSNFGVTSVLRPLIETMWSESSTFKGQCARLGQAPSLLVEIRFGNASQLGGRSGRTDFVRSSGRIARADIYIGLELRSVTGLVEMIAHELEHVVEQLDDVELTPDGSHGVYLITGGVFETARAIHIGRRVSREVSARASRKRAQSEVSAR